MGLHYSMYERITELVSLLNDFDLEPTLRKISTITETSLSRTREDLYQLRKAGLPVCPEEVISSLRRDDSRYDDEVLWIDLDLSPDSRLLFLNDTERNLFVSSRFRKMLIKTALCPFRMRSASARR